MLGTKINKPVITQEQCNEYEKIAKWCNEHNCYIDDKSEYYEVVENIQPEPQPTEMDKISAQVMYTALMTDTLLESEGEE